MNEPKPAEDDQFDEYSDEEVIAYQKQQQALTFQQQKEELKRKLQMLQKPAKPVVGLDAMISAA